MISFLSTFYNPVLSLHVKYHCKLKLKLLSKIASLLNSDDFEVNLNLKHKQKSKPLTKHWNNFHLIELNYLKIISQKMINGLDYIHLALSKARSSSFLFIFIKSFEQVTYLVMPLRDLVLNRYLDTMMTISRPDQEKMQ